ncbi:MAG: hypothetical protein QFB86_00485 [Patescibacteria group bacterium]|nr:hypothetical protein [Patescibacteria group bacterium]
MSANSIETAQDHTPVLERIMNGAVAVVGAAGIIAGGVAVEHYAENAIGNEDPFDATTLTLAGFSAGALAVSVMKSALRNREILRNRSV